MTVREHLAKAHGMIAEHHEFKAEHHKAMAGHYSKLAKFHKVDMGEAEDEASSIFEEMAKTHHASAANHDEHAEFHRAQAAECEKVATGDLAKSDLEMNRLIPDNVRGVLPDYPGVHAVLRAGQREISKTTTVPIELDSIVPELEM